MNYIPFDRMKNRLETSKADSDLGYFFDLLLYGEFLTKIISLYMVSSINDDTERTRYRFEHALSRANAIGDFSKAIEEIVNGPASQLITSDLRDFELKELTQRSTLGDWQYDAQILLNEALKVFEIENNQLPSKSPLRNWFQQFTLLRNKTKGHGAPKTTSCNLACPLVEKSIELIANNFTGFKRPWAHLHRNLNGKYRISKLIDKLDSFDFLKREPNHSYLNGIYVFLDKPRLINLFYTNPELSDFFISNGNLKKDNFETISYISDERKYEDATQFLTPITQLPKSHTEGTTELQVLGNCLTNLPKPQDLYVNRFGLETELKEVLLHKDRFPVITLLGRGGVGKTSLALNLLTTISELDRFDLIIWFSARDIDLLIDGPKQVQTKVLTIEDIAKDYCTLVSPDTKITNPIQFFSNELTQNSLGNTLYVFDNFETVTNPVEVFEWINTYIRNPNKVLITSRISRNFKADYPIEIHGMSEEECKDLIQSSAESFGISHLITQSYINELITESDGHPYIIKILLGEVARTKKLGKIKRIVADQDKILSALFKRTFNTLSPAAKRVFLTLCSWNSMVPLVAVEAVLWRPENEKMDVQEAIEELRKSSFIEVINQSDEDIINVPLAATIFGKAELEVYPEKIAVLSDRKLLIEFGATSYTNLSNGVILNIEKKFKAISRRINSIEEFESELPILEYIASKFPKTYEFIIEIYEEYFEYEKVKYYIREYLKTSLLVNEKAALWLKLSNICKVTDDWNGESHALTEMVQTPNISIDDISAAANRINNHIYFDYEAKLHEYKTEMLTIVIDIFMSKIKHGNATDYSRLGWLLLNANQGPKALEIVNAGLQLDSENQYCLKLKTRLEYNLANMRAKES